MPENHSLFWIYGYIESGENKGYTFDTKLTIEESLESVNQFKDDGYETIIVFYGNSDGAFTGLDPVLSIYPDD